MVALMVAFSSHAAMGSEQLSCSEMLTLPSSSLFRILRSLKDGTTAAVIEQNGGITSVRVMTPIRKWALAGIEKASFAIGKPKIGILLQRASTLPKQIVLLGDGSLVR